MIFARILPPSISVLIPAIEEVLESMLVRLLISGLVSFSSDATMSSSSIVTVPLIVVLSADVDTISTAPPFSPLTIIGSPPVIPCTFNAPATPPEVSTSFVTPVVALTLNVTLALVFVIATFNASPENPAVVPSSEKSLVATYLSASQPYTETASVAAPRFLPPVALTVPETVMLSVAEFYLLPPVIATGIPKPPDAPESHSASADVPEYTP